MIVYISLYGKLNEEINKKKTIKVNKIYTLKKKIQKSSVYKKWRGTFFMYLFTIWKDILIWAMHNRERWK